MQRGVYPPDGENLRGELNLREFNFAFIARAEYNKHYKVILAPIHPDAKNHELTIRTDTLKQATDLVDTFNGHMQKIKLIEKLRAENNRDIESSAYQR